jgi:hypothetical protein
MSRLYVSVVPLLLILDFKLSTFDLLLMKCFSLLLHIHSVSLPTHDIFDSYLFVISSNKKHKSSETGCPCQNITHCSSIPLTIKLIWQPLYRFFILDIRPTNRPIHAHCPLSHMSTLAPQSLMASETQVGYQLECPAMSYRWSGSKVLSPGQRWCRPLRATTTVFRLLSVIKQ